MSKQWQIRRGTTVENDSFTGVVGEITMDTDKNQIRLHDGTTQGGHVFGDTVVEWQVPTAQNGYTWYRKYRSGWIEQSGRLTDSTGVATFPVEMSDTNYNLQVRLDYNSTGTIQGRYWYATKTTTGFTLGAFLESDWVVCGMAA